MEGFLVRMMTFNKHEDYLSCRCGNNFLEIKTGFGEKIQCSENPLSCPILLENGAETKVLFTNFAATNSNTTSLVHVNVITSIIWPIGMINQIFNY